jgi:hypothetical protein
MVYIIYYCKSESKAVTLYVMLAPRGGVIIAPSHS